jgi:hypothetical protein
VPVFVKLGVVPLCVTVKSPAVPSIVPLFVCAALARLSVSGWLIVTNPWLSSWTPSVRTPPVPTRLVIVPPAALVRMPVPLTFSTSV